MTKIKTNEKTRTSYAKNLEPIRYGTTRVLLARRALPRRLLGISVLLLSGVVLAAADEITDWNRIMLKATLTPPATPAPVSTRSTAIVQAAVFDAVNGIDPGYTPIFVGRMGPRHASRRAAAVQAATLS